MRGGVLAATLLCAALGVALAFAPRRTWPACLALLAGATMPGLALPIPPAIAGAVFLCGWLSVIACAATVHLPRGLSPGPAMLLSFNAGLWSGALVALDGHGPDVFHAWCGVLALLPATLAPRWRLAVAAKVVSSWLIAIAVLAAALPYLPVTPGYLPDHLE